MYVCIQYAHVSKLLPLAPYTWTYIMYLLYGIGVMKVKAPFSEILNRDVSAPYWREARQLQRHIDMFKCV